MLGEWCGAVLDSVMLLRLRGAADTDTDTDADIKGASVICA